MRLMEQGGGTTPHPSPMPEEELAPNLRTKGPVRPSVLPGRNMVCWCGSGKKYKKCHMSQDLAELGPEAAGAADSDG
jgi:hypothetical protein